MNPILVNDLIAKLEPGEVVEVRTVDGHTYVWKEPKMIHNHAVVLRQENQMTFIAVEHIVVFNIVTDVDAVYGARAPKPPTHV